MPDPSLIGIATRTLVIRNGMDPADMVWPTLDVRDIKPYTANFTRWVAAGGSPIISASVSHTSDPALSVSQAVVDPTGTIVTVILSGGTPGTTAEVGLTVTTADQSQSEFVISLSIVNQSANLIGGPSVGNGSSAPSNNPNSFVFTQSTPSSVWFINHGLGRYPNIVVVDSAGSEVEGGVVFNNINEVTLTFSASFAGTATLI